MGLLPPPVNGKSQPAGCVLFFRCSLKSRYSRVSCRRKPVSPRQLGLLPLVSESPPLALVRRLLLPALALVPSPSPAATAAAAAAATAAAAAVLLLLSLPLLLLPPLLLLLQNLLLLLFLMLLLQNLLLLHNGPHGNQPRNRSRSWRTKEQRGTWKMRLPNLPSTRSSTL